MVKPVFAAGLVLLTLAVLGRFRGTEIKVPRAHDDYVASSKEPTQQGLPNNSDDAIKGLIASLHDSNQAAKAQAQLIVIAKGSPGPRVRVVRLLLNDAASQSELDGRHVILSAEVFDYWFRSAQVFAELKATESIDLLIKCIYAGNGYGGSLGYQPAFSALVQIGAPAIPKLAVALSNRDDEYMRSQVAICLGSIGGSNAERVLARALKKESSADVVRYIKRGLAMIRGDSTSDLLFP